MRYESPKTENGNIGVSYVSQEKANEQAKIMDANDCTDCTGCRYCTDCTGCTGCRYCADCADCTGCTDCTGCEYFVDGKIAAEPAQQIENLDKVRAIILDNQERLDMGVWHGDDGGEWKNKTCAEEAICGTSHCLAGWLQVCSTDPEVRSMEPSLGGALQAPVAAKLFYSGPDEVLAWLTDREYVKELAADESAKA